MAKKNGMSGERLLWTIVAGICALPTVARVLRPALVIPRQDLDRQELTDSRNRQLEIGKYLDRRGRPYDLRLDS